MRKLGLLSASIAVTAILAGCGGGGGGSSSQVTRTVAGFVYVLGGTGSGGSAAVVIPTAVAPAGYFAPTSGTVTLSVPDGTISRAPDSEPFNMAVSNAVICSVKAKENTQISVTGSGLNFEGDPRSLAPFSVSIGVRANTNTVLTLNNGSTVYTPGPEASLFYTIDGNPPTQATQEFIAGGGAQSLSIVALDASGVVVPTATFNVSSDGPEVVVTGTNPGAGPFDLTPASSAVPEDVVAITIDSVDSNLQAVINGNFDHGVATTVNVVASVPTVTWGTTAPVVANTNTTVTATVLNQVGSPMPGEVVTFSTNKIPAAGNAWSGAEAALGGNAFATQSGPTIAGGTFASTFTPPTELNPVLNAGQLAVKGVNVITATAGSASGTVNVTILRPIGSLTIAGNLAVDTGTPASTYSITGALDVDGDTATLPSGSVTWTLTNTPSGGNIGNVGDESPASVSAASGSSTSATINVSPGNTAGQYTLQATIGTVNSNTLTTEVYGVPSKLFFNPATTASVIAGASGEYLTGGTGNVINVSFTFLDSYGHTVGGGNPGGSVGFNYTGNIDSSTGGSLNPGSGANNSAFTIVTGPGDGLFTITTQGSWNGTHGGTGNFNLQKSVGHNAP